MKLYIVPENNFDFNPSEASLNSIKKHAQQYIEGINATDLFVKVLDLFNEELLSDQNYFYLVDNHGNILND